MDNSLENEPPSEDPGLLALGGATFLMLAVVFGALALWLCA